MDNFVNYYGHLINDVQHGTNGYRFKSSRLTSAQSKLVRNKIEALFARNSQPYT